MQATLTRDDVQRPTPLAAALPLARRGAVFLGAFLLFNVQPMVAKVILPWFGGASAVWVTCMLFFQGFLLLGYLYAHLLVTRVPAGRQAWVHGALLAASLPFLPLAPRADLVQPGGEPVGSILLVLTACLGLPYLLLSATSPLVQGWHARSEGGAPYRLYALSNLGSLLGLVAFPFLIEPQLGSRAQLILWSGLFGIYLVLMAVLAFGSRGETVAARPGEASVRPSAGQVSAWLLLSALPTALLLAVTSHLTQNVTPMPFLWMLPLAVYLLTLILCFDRPQWCPRTPSLRLCGMALLVLCGGLLELGHDARLAVEVPLYTAGLFFCCVFLHGELQRQKPAPAALTAYYLTMSAGGALAGLLAAVAAPQLLSGPLDLPVCIAAVALVAHWHGYRRSRGSAVAWTSLLLVVMTVCWAYGHAYSDGAIATARNFYGSLRVADDDAVRTEMHGAISHGVQFLEPSRRAWATAYYGPDSGAARAIQSFPRPVRVGLVGLGIGTLATYAQPGDEFRFYEINPMVVDFARRHFTFLRDCAGCTAVVEGDARLSLEREWPRRYQVLVLDAFSGDAIPAHLLTREAFALYRRHLAPDGLLAVHISNAHLDLEPVVRAGAAAQGWTAAVRETPRDDERHLIASTWVVAGPEASVRRAVPASQRDAGRGSVAWTDDHSSLFPVLKRP